MNNHQISKGFDIRLAGKPESKMEQAAEPLLCGLRPREFPGIKPKLLVKEGETVATGDPLFRDKKNPDTVWLSPVTGKVSKIELGKRRFPELIELSPVAEERFADVPKIDPQQLPSTDRAQLVAAIKGAGLWPLIRQRPIGRIADGSQTPVAIYVNGMDTEPLAADPAIAVMDQGTELQMGVDLLRALSGGKVYLTVDGKRSMPQEFQNLNGVEVHQFEGPHPAGLVGTHISRIQPLKSGEVAWYLKAQEAALLGAWIKSGHYPAMRTVAVVGHGVPQRQYFRVRQGAALMTLTGGKPLEGDARLINGTVLNGISAPADGYLGYYAQTLTVITEGGGKRDLFGWALPQFGQHSSSRAVWSWVSRKDAYELDARMHGGPRHMVNIGQMDKVTPLDIHVPFLLRSIMANDLEEAIHLGLLEVTEEDVALCTFADASKTEVGEIIRKGLDMFEEEG